jgi:hypothetical protein
VSPEPRPLPMAPSGCALDDRQLVGQLERCRSLSRSVLGVERQGVSAVIRFERQVDAALVEETIAIERGCCSFFVLDYDASERLLSITTEPDREDALEALLAALRGRSIAAPGR